MSWQVTALMVVADVGIVLAVPLDAIKIRMVMVVCACSAESDAHS